MLLTTSHFGLPQQQWDEAKRQAKDATRVRVRGMIECSDLVQRITAVELQAHDTRLFHLLGEISVEEDTADRGMLSVVVVHKVGDVQPGPEFFELASLLGRNTSDILRCWVEELTKAERKLTKTLDLVLA